MGQALARPPIRWTEFGAVNHARGQDILAGEMADFPGWMSRGCAARLRPYAKAGAGTLAGDCAPRTRRPGRAPVGWSFLDTTWPATIVQR
jgi:hypothetical protein